MKPSPRYRVWAVSRILATPESRPSLICPIRLPPTSPLNLCSPVRRNAIAPNVMYKENREIDRYKCIKGGYMMSFQKIWLTVSLFKTEPSRLNLAYFSCRICSWPHIWAILLAIHKLGGSCLVLRVMLTRSLPKNKKAPKALSSRLWGTWMGKILHFSEDVLALKNNTCAVWLLKLPLSHYESLSHLECFREKYLSRFNSCNFWSVLSKIVFMHYIVHLILASGSKGRETCLLYVPSRPCLLNADSIGFIKSQNGRTFWSSMFALHDLCLLWCRWWT